MVLSGGNSTVDKSSEISRNFCSVGILQHGHVISVTNLGLLDQTKVNRRIILTDSLIRLGPEEQFIWKVELSMLRSSEDYEFSMKAWQANPEVTSDFDPLWSFNLIDEPWPYSGNIKTDIIHASKFMRPFALFSQKEIDGDLSKHFNTITLAIEVALPFYKDTNQTLPALPKSHETLKDDGILSENCQTQILQLPNSDQDISALEESTKESAENQTKEQSKEKLAQENQNPNPSKVLPGEGEQNLQSPKVSKTSEIQTKTDMPPNRRNLEILFVCLNIFMVCLSFLVFLLFPEFCPVFFLFHINLLIAQIFQDEFQYIPLFIINSVFYFNFFP